MHVNKLNTEFRANSAARLRAERERLGFSQAQIAELGQTKQRTYQDWERGLSVVSSEFLAQMSAHGIDPLYVLTGRRANDPNQTTHPAHGATLGERLQQERERLGLSLGEMGKAGGADRFLMVKFENNELTPQVQHLLKWYEMGVDVQYVLLGVSGGGSQQVGDAEADEQELLKAWRGADEKGRAALSALAEVLLNI